MAFPIPRSLKKYYEERAVFKAVNELVGVLDGSQTPKLSRKEAKNYNQALLMAAQVRADFVDLLFRVWDETFWKAKITRKDTRKEWLDSSPNNIWDGGLGVSNYYGAVKDGGQSDTLGVTMVSTDDDTHIIYLYVYRFDRDDVLAARPACVPSGLEGWEITPGDDDDWWFQNKSVDMVDFLENPGPPLDRFRREAVKMVEFLASSSA